MVVARLTVVVIMIDIIDANVLVADGTSVAALLNWTTPKRANAERAIEVPILIRFSLA